MQKYLDFIQTAVALFLAFGGGTWLSKELDVKASTEKNENVKFMETIASQIILAAQSFYGTGADQKKEAIVQAQERLDANGLGDKFDLEQIAQYIEKAYATAKANGQLDAVKKAISDAEYEAAEKAIKGE